MAVFYLDAEGYVIVPLDPRERTAPLNQTTDQLPVISGLNGNQLQAGRHIEAPQLVGALELLSAFEHSPMQPLVDLKIINVSASEVLVVTTGQGSEITFGLKDLDQQLRRWRTIFTLAQQANKAIGTLDLAVTNNLPARFVEASAVPASTPKAPKLPKKKHV
jgi:cell division septal protein FtsQ